MRYIPAQAGADSGGCRAGARNLLETMSLLSGFGMAKGCYNPRSVRGGTGRSVHAEGAAIDPAVDAWAIGHDRTWAPPPLSWGTAAGSDPILVERMGQWCDTLAAKHDDLGIQQIIFWGRIWTCERLFWRPFTGNSGPHYDHAHIELHPSRRDSLTPSEIMAVVLPRADLTPNPTEDDVLPTIYTFDGDNVVLKEGDGNPTHVTGMETLTHLRTRGCPEVVLRDPEEWDRKRILAGMGPRA